MQIDLAVVAEQLRADGIEADVAQTGGGVTSLPPEQLQAEQAYVEGRYVGRRFRRVTDRTEGTATAAKANAYGGNPTLTITWDDGTASQRSLSAVVSLPPT